MCAQFGSVWWDPPLDQVTSSRGTGMDVSSTAKDAPLPSQFNFPPFPIIFCFSQKMELVWIQLKRLSFFFLPYFISPFSFPRIFPFVAHLYVNFLIFRFRFIFYSAACVYFQMCQVVPNTDSVNSGVFYSL